MKIIKDEITIQELKAIAQKSFGILVKAVVDVKKEIMVIDAELHADQEVLLLKNGSLQQDLWGINLYPFLKGNNFIEFDSMINLRPNQNNLSRGVDNPLIREKIIKIINKLVQK